MSEKVKIELSSPFGPTILKAKLPEELIKDLNTDCDEIVAKKRKQVDWSHQLAGRVKEEWHITKDTLSKYYGWVGAVTSRYLFPDDKMYAENKDKIIKSNYRMRNSCDKFMVYRSNGKIKQKLINYRKKLTWLYNK